MTTHGVTYLQMHARCCGLDDAVYRFAVNQQSAGNDPCWPCSSCARRHATTTLSTTTSSRQQQPPPDVPASPPPSSSQQQPAANGSGIVEFIHVARGGLRLCYQGHSYTKKATKTNRIRWECSQRKTLNCKGAVTTSLVVCYYLCVFIRISGWAKKLHFTIIQETEIQFYLWQTYLYHHV